NQALGQLELCKAMVASDTGYNDHVTFVFKVDGAKSGPLAGISVVAGHCSMPLVVPVGSHTISEKLPYGFQLVSVTATGPTGDNRVVSGTNPVTVSVPYFSDPANGGETLVTFTNRVLRAQVKICKVVEPGSKTPLAGNGFPFFVQADGLGDITPSPQP